MLSSFKSSARTLRAQSILSVHRTGPSEPHLKARVIQWTAVSRSGGVLAFKPDHVRAFARLITHGISITGHTYNRQAKAYPLQRERARGAPQRQNREHLVAAVLCCDMQRSVSILQQAQEGLRPHARSRLASLPLRHDIPHQRRC